MERGPVAIIAVDRDERAFDPGALVRRAHFSSDAARRAGEGRGDGRWTHRRRRRRLFAGRMNKPRRAAAAVGQAQRGKQEK